MSNRYHVSIPVEPVIQDEVEFSISHRLGHGLVLCISKPFHTVLLL